LEERRAFFPKVERGLRARFSERSLAATASGSRSPPTSGLRQHRQLL